MPIFKKLLPTDCETTEITDLFRTIALEFSELSIHGDGDRRCIFNMGFVPCQMMNFFDLKNIEEFIKQFEVLSYHILSDCGRDSFRSKWTPKINSLV